MKRIASLLLALVMACSAITGCGIKLPQPSHSNNSDNDVTTEKITVKVSEAPDGYIGRNFQSVKSQLMKDGFVNIDFGEVDDIDDESTDEYGDVIEISIDGKTDFKANDHFDNDVEIVITYHTYKQVEIPFSNDDAKNMDLDALVSALSEAGFVDVSTEEITDLDPDFVTGEYENEILVDGESNFYKDDKIPYNAKISVVHHLPLERFTAFVHVDCQENLIFSKYAVDISVDGEKSATLAHGASSDYEISFLPGKHTLTFSNSEDSSVNGSVEFEIKGDVEAEYQIHCFSDEVSVETVYFVESGSVSDNELLVPISSSECEYKNYQEVMTIFENAGFTNISTDILYDIDSWSIEEEGEIEDVSIDGKTTFKKGDIYSKDAAIIVRYHMNMEEDPEPPVIENSLSYTTNDLKTAKLGNTGVFSYKSTGGTYSNYYIIDFDEGYVYFFSDGNGSKECDRVKIVSGDLNSYVLITYHEGGEEWSEALSFKWVNQPDRLVVQDGYGFKYDFNSTNLKDALAIRDTKVITDY